MRLSRQRALGMRLGLAFLGLLGVAADAAAQAPSQSVPADLVNALVAPSSGTPPSEFFVGVAPPGWPAALHPTAPATVLGGLRNRRQLTLLFVDSTTRHPLAAYTRALEGAGWTRPPIAQLPGFQDRGGFQSSDGRQPFWCRDSTRVRLTERPDSAGFTRVRVAYEMLAAMPCAPTPTLRASVSAQLAVLDIPPLLPPTGLRSVGSGSSSAGSSMYVRTSFDSTTMTPRELLAHYAAQLTAAGWRSFAPTVADSFAAQHFEVRDEWDRIWRGTLLVMPTGHRRDVGILMARPDIR